MKQFSVINTTILILLFGTVFTLISCEKDDGSSDKILAPENGFVYNGDKYSTPEAFVLIWGYPEDEFTEFTIVLHSSGIEVEYLDYDVEISGMGDFVYLEISTDNYFNTLPEGEFPYDTDAGNSFYMSEVLIDMDYNSEEENEIYLEERTGHVSISKIGDSYQIDYTLQLTNGRELIGSFKGIPMQVLD